MARKLSKSRRAVLEALAKGKPRVRGRLADPTIPDFAPATAFIGRREINPADIDALANADLIERNWEGLGNWTATITPAGRAALTTEAKPAGGDNE